MADVTYEQIYSELCHSIDMLIFSKKNGELRVMLATKNESLAMISNKMQLIPSGYMRESKESGNIAVIDLEEKQRRSFNIDRLLDHHSFGSILSEQDYARIYNEYVEFKIKYLEELNRCTISEEDNSSEKFKELFN